LTGPSANQMAQKTPACVRAHIFCLLDGPFLLLLCSVGTAVVTIGKQGLSGVVTIGKQGLSGHAPQISL